MTRAGTDRTIATGRVAVALSAALLAAAPASGQQPPTRAAALASEREAKAETLAPPEPNRLRELLDAIEDGSLQRKYRLAQSGFHVKFTGITNGGGFAVGPAYKAWRALDGHADALAFLQVSTKRYWIAGTALEFPRLASGRVTGRAFATARYLAQEDYYGTGPGSRLDDRVSFGYRESSYGGDIGVKPVSWLTIGGGLGWFSPRIRRGEDSRVPTIQAVFAESDTAGLARQPTFNLYGASAEVDYTEPRGNPRSGGRYRVSQTWYDDRDLERFTFGRTDVELWQYLGVLHDRRVLALHALVSTSAPRAGQRVPFFLQQTLGGSNSLRGFREFRFRDAHLILLQAEYRWEVFPALDGALFYDAGKVASRREDLDFRGLEQDWGIGFRFGTREGVFLRFDAAFGSREGTRLYVKFGDVF